MSISEVLRVTGQKAFTTQEAFANKIHITSARSKSNLTAIKLLNNLCEKNNLDCEMIETEWLTAKLEAKK